MVFSIQTDPLVQNYMSHSSSEQDFSGIFLIQSVIYGFELTHGSESFKT